MTLFEDMVRHKMEMEKTPRGVILCPQCGSYEVACLTCKVKDARIRELEENLSTIREVLKITESPESIINAIERIKEKA